MDEFAGLRPVGGRFLRKQKLFKRLEQLKNGCK